MLVVGPSIGPCLASAGLLIESDHFGKVRKDSKGCPQTSADAALERKNHAYAVEKLRKTCSGEYGAEAWGRPIHAWTGTTALEQQHIDEEAILAYRAQRGGCSCQPDKFGKCCATKRCKSCHKNGIPCNFRCKCRGLCNNPCSTPVVEGCTATELRDLDFAAIARKLTPRDLEAFVRQPTRQPARPSIRPSVHWFPGPSARPPFDGASRRPLASRSPTWRGGCFWGWWLSMAVFFGLSLELAAPGTCHVITCPKEAPWWPLLTWHPTAKGGLCPPTKSQIGLVPPQGMIDFFEKDFYY